MAIKVFMHVAPMNHWQEIVGKIEKAIRVSGLADACDEVSMNLAEMRKLKLGRPFESRARSKLREYEFPALELLREKTNDGDKILYLHTKGASNPKEPWLSGNRKWLDFMLWANVEHWREMVDALDIHDVAGANWIDKPGVWEKRCGAPGFYGGNFWWSTGSYIKRLAPIPREQWGNRWLAEGWIGTGRPRVFDIRNLTGGGLIKSDPPNTFFLKEFSRADYDGTIAVSKTKRRGRVRSRIEIINTLIDRHDYKSYLEIGVFQGNCLNAVRCDHKISVDPAPKCPVTYRMTSDEYFARVRENFDIVFIDGLHTEVQVKKDIANALERLNDGGTIVCHDCLPESEWQQRDTEDYDGNGVWVGTVWREFARLRMTRPDLWMGVINTDCGVGLIRRGKQETYPEGEITYPEYWKNRKQMMNVISPEDFYEGIGYGQDEHPID